jgi:hypothetical protein
VAVDISCHTATALKWHGCAVIPGGVVYIFAEGPFGARSRIDAWCECYAAASGLPLNRRELSLWLLPTRLPLNNPSALAGLIKEIDRLAERPVLVVVDTLNQNLDGDEDGRGMGAFVGACVILRDRYGATILVVHHTPQSSDDRGRGHGAFDGALDTRLIVSRDADRVTVDCTHQRNAEDGWSVAYEVVKSADSLALKPSSPAGGDLKGQRRQLLEVVSQQGPLSYSAWLKLTEIKTPSFKKARSWLVARAYVTQSGAKYSITESGTAALWIPGTPEGHRG